MKPVSEPKRRNAEKTKARILEVAERQFANAGYSQTGFRDIARTAEVAPSLLVRHFGSKTDLFEATLLSAMENNDFLKGDRATCGVRMAHLLAGEVDTKLPAMVVLSLGDADARERCATVLKERMIAGLAKWLAPPNEQQRALNLMMIMTGFVIYARQLPLGPVDQYTLDWLARSIQEIVDG